MKTDGDAPTGPKNNRYGSLYRVPGLLFATAALVVLLSGSLAVDLPPLPADRAAPAADEHVDTPPRSGAMPASTAHRAAPQTDATGPTVFTTGDHLDADQRAEFAARIAAMKADGHHRGPAFYTSW